MELDEIDFTNRPWVPGSGWPIRKSNLADHYARAIAIEGLGRSIFDDRDIWKESGYLPENFGDDLTFAFSRYCPERKFSRLFASTINRSQNLTIVLHANACQLMLAEDGRTVEAVRCRTVTGKQEYFTADRFVLCLGGIESSRFLLQPYSASPWNQTLVGCHFQDHIHCFAADVFDAKLIDKNWHYGPYPISLHGHSYLPKIKMSATAQQRYRVLNVNGMVEYDDGVYPALRTAILMLAGPLSAIKFRDLAYTLPRIPMVLCDHFARKRNPNFVLPTAKLKLSVYCEQSPLSASRIALSQKRDALGLFCASIDWKISAQEIETVRRYVQVARDAFAKNGLARIVPDANLFADEIVNKFSDTFHHIGGTRMSSSPSSGVVDPNLLLFGTRNAYVCSSSVFPASGFANPTHTVIALAVRLARHLSDLPSPRRISP